MQFEDDDVSQDIGSQLDSYLEEARLPPKYHPNLDLLQYWKENQIKYPDLALMACDILSVQITTVASESAFSIGSRILNKYRSSLLPDNVQSLICTKNWLLGFEIEGKYYSLFLYIHIEHITLNFIVSKSFNLLYIYFLDEVDKEHTSNIGSFEEPTTSKMESNIV